jgi:hypothetical protein
MQGIHIPDICELWGYANISSLISSLTIESKIRIAACAFRECFSLTFQLWDMHYKGVNALRNEFLDPRDMRFLMYATLE